MIKREYRDVLHALAHIVASVHNYSMENLDPYEERRMLDIYTGLLSLSKEPGESEVQK